MRQRRMRQVDLFDQIEPANKPWPVELNAEAIASCSLSQTGYRPSGCIPPRRFTNVDDVTQDHANQRAVCTIATSVFRGAVFHLATTPPPRVSSARFAAGGRLLR